MARNFLDFHGRAVTSSGKFLVTANNHRRSSVSEVESNSIVNLKIAQCNRDFGSHGLECTCCNIYFSREIRDRQQKKKPHAENKIKKPKKKIVQNRLDMIANLLRLRFFLGSSSTPFFAVLVISAGREWRALVCLLARDESHFRAKNVRQDMETHEKMLNSHLAILYRRWSNGPAGATIRFALKFFQCLLLAAAWERWRRRRSEVHNLDPVRFECAKLVHEICKLQWGEKVDWMRAHDDGRE